MKQNLTWGWVFAILAVVMFGFVIYGICIGNAIGATMCGFACVLNATNATTRFLEVKYQREWNESIERLSEAFRTCWPEEDEEESDGDNRITD